jgi:hypothetical protein
MNTGILEMQGDVYLLDRSTQITSPMDYTAGTKVGRLGQVLRYKLGMGTKVYRKNGSPAGARVAGRWVEIEATFVDLTQKFIELATNQMNKADEIYWSSSSGTYKAGHALREANLSPIIIRETAGTYSDFPVLYMPWAFCLDMEHFAARAAEHTEFAQLTLLSIDYKVDVPAFEYGDVEQFEEYDGGVA